ncbi:hypothetical protein ACFVG9_39925, partial [Saccharothrix carnea]
AGGQRVAAGGWPVGGRWVAGGRGRAAGGRVALEGRLVGCGGRDGWRPTGRGGGSRGRGGRHRASGPVRLPTGWCGGR